MRAHLLLLAALALMASAVTSGPGHAQEREQVTITSPLAGLGPFTALLLRPQGAGPFPAIIALHGCGGLLNKEGELARRETDWAKRLVGAGYVVLFPDSFTARGLAPDLHRARSRHLSQGPRRRRRRRDGMACQAALCRQQAARPHGLVARGHDDALGGATGLHGRRTTIQDGHRLLSGLPRDRASFPTGARGFR